MNAAPNKLPATPEHIREQLQSIVLADLLGPANGPTEIVDEGSVRDRYLVGRLGPQGQTQTLDAEDSLTVDDTEGELATAGVDGEDGTAEASTARVRSMQPSSLGLSFIVSGFAQALQLTARWGHYVREKGEGEEYTTKPGRQRSIWRRVPVDRTSGPIQLTPGRMTVWIPNPEQPNVRVEGLIRRRIDQWHVTLFLVNGQQEPKRNKDAVWIFQPELVVEDVEGRPIFEHRPGGDRSDELEVRAMAMTYRKMLEFAVGHGSSIHADLAAADPSRAVRLSTRVVPLFDVPQTRAFEPEGLLLDMSALADVPDGDFGAALMPMPAA